MPVLARPRSGRVVAGVCAGLARRFGVSALLVRVLFLVSCLLPGPQLVLYAALWLLLPADGAHAPARRGRTGQR